MRYALFRRQFKIGEAGHVGHVFFGDFHDLREDDFNIQAN